MPNSARPDVCDPDVETEQLLSAQLQKARQQADSVKVEASRIAAEVKLLHRSMLDLTSKVSKLLATTR